MASDTEFTWLVNRLRYWLAIGPLTGLDVVPSDRASIKHAHHLGRGGQRDAEPKAQAQAQGWYACRLKIP